MRRLSATLLLALIGLFLAAPLLALSPSDPDAGLPACCRRNGNHQCAMTDQAVRSFSFGKQVRQLHQHCPFFPRAVTAPTAPFHAAPAPSATYYAQIASHPALHPQTRAAYRVSLNRSRQKRGPPAIV